MSVNKIFCIGLNKTGTTSLHEAFKILGYRSVHYGDDKVSIGRVIYDNYSNNEMLLRGIEKYDVYLDWSTSNTNFLFKKFDEQYPDSKFILNTRDLDSWLKSREKHVKNIPNIKEKQLKEPNNNWYNINKNAWTEEYFNHHEQVNDYFSNRKDDFLVFNLFEGDGWEKLCAFLDKPIPNKTFPKVNQSQNCFFRIYKEMKKMIKSLILKRYKK